MSAYLGTLGRLIPIYSTPTMTVSGIPARTYETTLEGRVKAQVKPIGRREWGLSAESAMADEIGALMGFAAGEWGHGPFVWVSPTAPAINLLTPAQASCDPSIVSSPDVYVSGPLDLGADGFAGRSLTNSAPGSNMYFGLSQVPVLQGEQLTVSAYLLGDGARVGVTFQGSDGADIAGASVESAEVGNAGSAVRLSLSTTPPVGAVSCRVYGSNTVQGARPAVTWTSALLGWGAGEGCPKAIVDTVERTALRSSRTASNVRRSDLSFSIREVG